MNPRGFAAGEVLDREDVIDWQDRCARRVCWFKKLRRH
jgi:hypothetical protein